MQLNGRIKLRNPHLYGKVGGFNTVYKLLGNRMHKLLVSYLLFLENQRLYQLDSYTLKQLSIKSRLRSGYSDLSFPFTDKPNTLRTHAEAINASISL